MQFLLALVIAVTLGVIGYLVLLSLHQDPLQPSAPPTLAEMRDLPEPKRLARRPSFAPAAAGRDAFPRAMRSLGIEVRGLSPELLEGSGVGVFDQHDHEVAWLPLANATARNGALTVTTSAPEGRLRLVVASDAATARNSYWTSVDWPAEAPPEQVAELRAEVQQVTVRCATEDRAIATTLRLRRQGDARWAPRTAFVDGAAPLRDGSLRLQLAAGTYEITPWNEGAFATTVISVPGPALVDAKFLR